MKTVIKYIDSFEVYLIREYSSSYAKNLKPTYICQQGYPVFIEECIRVDYLSEVKVLEVGASRYKISDKWLTDYAHKALHLVVRRIGRWT